MEFHYNQSGIYRLELYYIHIRHIIQNRQKEICQNYLEKL